MTRSALALLVLVGGALAAPGLASAQCTFPGTAASLTDGDGFLWDIDTAGNVVNGTIDAYDVAMSLQVGGTYFSGGAVAVNGREIAIGPVTVGGLSVTRKIYVSDTDGWARWVDLFENASGADISVDLTYEINPGSDGGTQIISTSSGDNLFTTADRWEVTDDSSNGGGDPTLNHNIHDGRTLTQPSSVSNTVFDCAGTQGTRWDYSAFTIATGKTVGLMTLLGQNSNQADAISNANALDAQTAGLDGLAPADRGAIINRLLPKNVLFVADSLSDTNIPSALTPDGHTVTSMTSQYNSGTQATAALTGSLSAYDAVIWSATGTGFGDANSNAAMLSNLELYVSGGGRVYVTGYDSIASPTDPALAQFVGGTGSVRDVPPGPGPIANINTSVTNGLVDIRGLQPSGFFSDLDALTGLAVGTIELVQTSTVASESQWVIRPLGAGEIAYISNGQNGTSQHPSWVDPTSVYNATLRNFVFGGGAGNPLSNVPPVADAGGPYTVGQGDPLALDGTGSTDSDGTVALYEWDCTNDGVFDTSSTSGTGSTCTYPDDGSYTVRLQVTDDFGDTATDTATVTVTNDLPTAEANGPYAGNAGAAIALTANGSSDSDGSITTYAWDCTTDGVYDVSGAAPTGLSCTYPIGGTYTVTLRVTDDDGGQDTDTATVNVNFDPVADAGGPYAANLGVPLSLDGSGSTDSGGSIVSYEWDCTNDGVIDSTVASPTTGSCTYLAAGTVTLRLRVTDNLGSVDEDTTTVTVNGPPVADAGGPYAGNQGSPIALSGAGSSDAEGPIALYQWDCTSDGSIDVTSTSPGAQCIYPAPLVYTATLTVTDAGGLTASDTAVVSASNSAPLADAGGPYTANQGAPVNLDGSGSSDPDGSIVQWAWDCGNDGVYEILASSPTGSVCSYPDDGPQVIGLRVTDNNGDQGFDTANATITNTPPVANADNVNGGAYTGTKNVAIAMNGSASSDPDGTLVSYAWDCTTDGSVDVTSASSTGSTCTYPAVGTYTVTLVVTDDDGATDSDTNTVNVGNDPPSAVAGGPYSGNENTPIPLDGSGSSDPGGALVTWSWDCTTDGSIDVVVSTPTAACVYDDEGTYTATLTVTDDNGATDSDSTTVTVSNIDPVIANVSVPSGNEGASLTFSASASDAAGDTLTYTWDFGDGTSGTGASTTHVYADDGSYSVTLVVTDGDGGSASTGGTATIANVAPEITSTSAPTTGDEGEVLNFSVTVADAGSADVPGLVVTWSWGDGSPDDVGLAVSHAFPDDGVYTVAVSVDDLDGGIDSQNLTVTTANVDPTITSSPPTNAVQGGLYSYSPIVSDPGTEVFAWSLSPSASSNTTVDTATGQIDWIPDAADYAQGTFTLVLTVNDGDGGSDAQSWTVNVAFADTDGDGMSDDWESANGLDPNDPNDAGQDPDLDGATNLQEFGLGQDPFSFDGPDAPVLVSPIALDEVVTDRPDLLVDNANDPQGDTLSYTYEVYSDAALSVLVTSISGVPETAAQTQWKVDLPLAENGVFWWRAAAADSFVTGPFSAAESFFVSQVKEAPEVPVLVYPVAGEIAPSLTPNLQWSESFDPDFDPVTYDVEVYDANEALVTATTGVVGDGVAAEWTVDVSLMEDGLYWWTARAVDDEGLESAWAELESFFVSSANEAPVGAVFVDPLDGDSIASQAPDLVASEAVDPEGTAVTYLFEIDSEASFSSADYDSEEIAHNGSGEVVWALSDFGIVLPANELTYARVRAVDADGISSAPDTISFFVRGDNDAPSVPVLVSPADGAEGPARPVLVVEDPTDSEGDTVFLEFVVAWDEELTDVITGFAPVLSGAGDGTTSWPVDVSLSDDVFWSARSIDSLGAMSDWATPWRYAAPGEVVAGDDDDSGATTGGGCDCASSMAGEGGNAWALLLLLPVVGVMRRRR